MMSKTNEEWATPTLKEAPFWHEGMTPEEYDAENEYLERNFHMLIEGTYKPLWKLKE